MSLVHQERQNQGGLRAGREGERVAAGHEEEGISARGEMRYQNHLEGFLRNRSPPFTFTTTSNRNLPSSTYPPSLLTPTPTSLGHPHQVIPTSTPPLINQILPSFLIFKAVFSRSTARHIPFNNLMENRTPVSRGSATQHTVHLHLPSEHLFRVSRHSTLLRPSSLAIRKRNRLVSVAGRRVRRGDAVKTGNQMKIYTRVAETANRRTESTRGKGKKDGSQEAKKQNSNQKKLGTRKTSKSSPRTATPRDPSRS